MELSDKDVEKLQRIQQAISEGTACSYDKVECLQLLDSVLNPRCVVCRKTLEGDYVIVNDKKMHAACSKRYKK